MFTQFTNYIPTANETFKFVHSKARSDALFRRLLGKRSYLRRIDPAAASKSRRYLGDQVIQADQINGSLGRVEDFDCQFRPLKDHYKDRWVKLALGSTGAGWFPVKLLKVDDCYYVIDGHLRVSVARSTGKVFIDAEVWEVAASPGTVEEAVCSSLFLSPARRPGRSTASPRPMVN